VREDIAAVRERDPAARNLPEILLCYPGLHALWFHRVSHRLWRMRLRLLARILSHIVRCATGVEIHPGALIGRRVVIDHGMGVVIGETAVIGDDVLLYQGVTLGGLRGDQTQRHPRVGNNVLLGANATLLGPIRVGDGAQIGACVTLRKSVPAGATVREEPIVSVRLPDERWGEGEA
jgi:serine O-acetyltransferase